MAQDIKVISKGGNQYAVTINDETRIIDLDGYTFCSDEDEQKLRAAGIDTENAYGGTLVWPEIVAEMSSVDDDAEFWKEAAYYAINYSGFDAEEAIKTLK